ncbi:zinc finger and BTB domain-containing protein 9 [Latimeria chalumnae]|uniref:zinc finger and BTB domain-containing protein 9 n=1 Tax=Latimeria chalumnae TaxID=7897 RepID=UPI0003C1345A|nr:PREDICTED: zinc finger and BTB domain-containing protein 9 [Latimeria chalumnae]|eukprot:XP_006001000.1 PREDICTED: zinc finger and BTB domain-containing protein 9 [Latimeria chalumnae]
MDSGNSVITIDFPNYSSALLETLNKHRNQGKFCDLSVHIQGRVFQAHKAVLAASSPYFHDKLLLNDTNCLVLPSVIDAAAFENVLDLVYTGKLTLCRDQMPTYLMVASGLQMWLVVNRCSELLKESEGQSSRPRSRQAGESQSPSSSNYPGPSRDDGDSKPGAYQVGSLPEGDDQDDIIEVRVSHDDDDDAEGEGPEEVCSGSLDRNISIVMEEEEDSRNVASCSYTVATEGHQQGYLSTKTIYIKQEKPKEEEMGALAARETSFVGTLNPASDTEATISISQVQAFCGTKYDSANQVDYIISSAVQESPSGFQDGGGGGGAAAATVLSDPGGFRQSSVASKPVDLHGNEIVGYSLNGQLFHAPVKIAAAPDGKKFGCLCGKRFAVKPKRDRHIMLTFSLRPFGCTICNKKFKLKHHLTEHMKTHEGHLHVCEDCGRKFRAESCFLKHKKVCGGQSWVSTSWNGKADQAAAEGLKVEAGGEGSYGRLCADSWRRPYPETGTSVMENEEKQVLLISKTF